jgi:hypothetical protein
LCTPDGRPVAVEAFEGNLGDPTTLAHQVKKLRMRFRLKRIVLVGDRGMITNARIDADLKPAGFDWIAAARARRRSRPWRPRAAPCTPGSQPGGRCSTSATWPRSSRTIFPASV